MLLIPSILLLQTTSETKLQESTLSEDIARDERGLEDLGIGYCHTEGAGWNENVTADDILGDNLAEDWVIIEARGKDANDSVVDTDNMTSQMNVAVYWAKLVRRPKCVDKITIKVGNVTQADIADPADFQLTKEKIVIIRKICETEIVEINIVNKRGGFDAHFSNVNLVRKQPDELFEFNLTLFGILDKTQDFISESYGNQITQNSSNRLSLSWNKDVFKTPELNACLTSAELVDGAGLVTPLDISEEDVELSVDECLSTNLTVRYKYQDTVFMTRVYNKVLHVSACLASGQVVVWSKFKVGLVILLTVLLLIVMLVVCMMKMQKKMKKRNNSSENATGLRIEPMLWTFYQKKGIICQ